MDIGFSCYVMRKKTDLFLGVPFGPGYPLQSFCTDADTKRIFASIPHAGEDDR